MEDRTGGARPAAVLGILLAIAFRGPLAGRMFYLRDISQNHYPIRRFVTERMRSFSLPLWDPYHGGGTPLLANPDNLVMHPISALFLALPYDVAFTASIVLQFVLLAGGGYLLARALGASRAGAAMAAAVLALSGPGASLSSLQNVLSAFAWVPLGLWAFLRGLEPGHRGRLALAALCLGVVLMTGEPASVLAFLLPAAGLAATRPAIEGAGRRVVPALGALAAVMLAGLLIAAAQILPARELLEISARSGGFPPGEALKWSLEPARLLEMLVPRLLGDPTRLSPEDWWGRWLFEGGYPFLMSIYLGAIPCLLALLALCRGGPGAARRRILGGIGAVGLLLALGRHSVLYRWLFAALPAVRQIRYPERFLLVALLALALLAAAGLDLLANGAVAWRRRALRAVSGTAAALFVVVTIVAAVPGPVDRFLSILLAVPAALLSADGGAIAHGALLSSALWVFAETAALALGTGMMLRPGVSRSGDLAAWGLVALSGLSMSAAAAPALSTAARGWLKTPSPLAAIVGRGPGAPRLHHDPRPEGLSVWGTTDELAWGYRFDRFTYTLASGHVDHVPTILDAATDRMDLDRQAGLGRALQALPLAGRLRVLSVCGAGYVISNAPLESPDLEAVPALEGFSLPPTLLYRMATTLARARFVPTAVGPSHPGDAAASLADPRFDPARAMLLDGLTPGSPTPGGASSGAAEILQDEPERIRIRVKAPAAGYLILSDAWAPGWRASLDGATVPLLRANVLFRAVALGSGEHEVLMTYRPRSVGRGIEISLFGLALAGLWAGATRRHGR